MSYNLAADDQFFLSKLEDLLKTHLGEYVVIHEKSIEGFKKHIGLLTKEYVTDEELSAAKMRLKQNITGQCQNPLSETALIAMNILEPFARLEKAMNLLATGAR